MHKCHPIKVLIFDQVNLTYPHLNISCFSDPVSHQILVKFCALYDSICHHMDTVTLCKDVLFRNHIIYIIMDWFQDPTLVSLTSSGLQIITQISQNTKLEAVHFQDELNFMSLHTADSQVQLIVGSDCLSHQDYNVHACRSCM
jgi:hypothetical protein